MSSLKYIAIATAAVLSLAVAAPLRAHDQRAGTVRVAEDGTILIAARETLVPGATFEVVRHVHLPGPGKNGGAPYVHRAVGKVRIVGPAGDGLVRAERVSGSVWRGDYLSSSPAAQVVQR